jgi:hypothetical protein
MQKTKRNGETVKTDQDEGYKSIKRRTDQVTLGDRDGVAKKEEKKQATKLVRP